MTEEQPIQEDGKPKIELDEDNNICRDYKRGVCNRGSKCKFVHPANVKPPDVDKPPICRDFQNGTCDRNNCKYLHITSHEERLFVSTGKLPSHVNFSATPGSGRRNGMGGDVCKDFLNNVCNRGNRCKFRHITEQEWQNEKRRAEIDDEMSRKRKRESFGGTSLDYQFLNDENDMLRRKVADLQRQVADLRAMNDTLYEQNMRYRTQLNEMSSELRGSGTVAYPGYSPRDREPSARYPPRDPYNGAVSSFTDRPAASSQSTAFSAGYTKDYNPGLSANTGTTSYEGYTKF